MVCDSRLVITNFDFRKRAKCCDKADCDNSGIKTSSSETDFSVPSDSSDKICMRRKLLIAFKMTVTLDLSMSVSGGLGISSPSKIAIIALKIEIYYE